MLPFLQLQSPVDLAHGRSDSFQARQSKYQLTRSGVGIVARTNDEGVEGEQEHTDVGGGTVGVTIPSTPFTMPVHGDTYSQYDRYMPMLFSSS